MNHASSEAESEGDIRAECCVGRPCGAALNRTASASLVWPISFEIALGSKGFDGGLADALDGSLAGASVFSLASIFVSVSGFDFSCESGFGFSGGFSATLVLTGGSGASSAKGLGGGGLIGGVGDGGAGLTGGCGG